MDSPYKFNPLHPRIVTNVQSQESKIYGASAALYLTSLYLYSRKFLRVDGNVVNFATFAVFSIPAAYSYSRFFLDSAENEAAKLNNDLEGHK